VTTDPSPNRRWPSVLKFVLPLAILATLIVGVLALPQTPQEFVINDVTRATSTELSRERSWYRSDSFVSGITLRIVGEIDGDAEHA
jgi:hypothetical protein